LVSTLLPPLCKTFLLQASPNLAWQTVPHYHSPVFLISDSHFSLPLPLPVLLMVISTDSDIYTPFPQMIIEDGPQSSEDGSGLHSPIFSAHFPQPHGDSSKSYQTRSLFKTTLIVISHVVHNKVRYHQDQLDIQHAAGILASQFDYTNIGLAAPHHHHHLLETPLDLHSNPNVHHHHPYSSEYSLPSRNHLGLDFPPHAYPNTRLPPPPAHGSALNLSYQDPPHRRYSTEDLHHHSYSSGGGSVQPSVAQPPESTQRSPVPRSEPTPQQHPTQPAASTSQDAPPREISNQVIACRQWCVQLLGCSFQTVNSRGC
jgi:hypothetical protein